jgi:hypothetical protein
MLPKWNSNSEEMLLRERIQMDEYHGLTSEERARITDIQDLLIECYVEQKKALEAGKKARAMKIGFEIKELRREMEAIKGLANV